MARGCAEISTEVQSAYRLKCFEDYFPGISALLDRAQWGGDKNDGEDKHRQRG